ncbi:beta strand repeat-containing protein [Verrucomicrobiota bacterium sgz303538]
MRSLSSLVSVIEILEDRIAPAVHTWIGAGTNNLWSNEANWIGGSPATDASGNIDLIFPTNAAQLVVQNDINNLTVDSITFNAAGGTSANGYTINGNAIFINTGGAGEDPFGIDTTAGVADATDGITQTFNTPIALIGNDATFRSVEAKTRLTFHGNIDLGGKTLTFDNTASGGNNVNTQGFLVDGDISNGSLIKKSTGTLQLSGNNSYANTTANGGFILATTDTALGSAVGTITINDPAQIQLRNGITVSKATLNLNANGLGGGLGADGNTTNTFRGSMVLMAGAGGVALGAGNGAANAGTRLVIDGVISGATSTLSLNGTGVIEFTRNNTYTGVTNLNGNLGFGALQIDSPAGLGAGGAGNGVQLNRNGAGPTGSALWLNFDGTLSDGVTGEVISFAGAGVGGLGAIRVLGDNDVVLSGSITLIAGAPWAIGVDDADGSITTSGVIDSQGVNRPLTKTGPGTLIIGGSAANTFQGGAIINGGILSVQNNSAAPLGNSAGGVIVNNASTLRVEAGVTLPNPVGLVAGGTLTGTGTVNSVVSAGGILRPGTDVGRITVGAIVLGAESEFVVDIHGTTAITDYDQLGTGSVLLRGASLTLSDTFAATPGTQFRLIDNGGSAAVDGTFAGLPEGAKFSVGGRGFQISYVGGTGNDVVLTALATPPDDLAIASDGKSATFTDVDGDLVTVKIKGKTAKLDASDFTFGFAAGDRPQLLRLALDADDAGANLTITAKHTEFGGDGFANVGYLSAAGVALGSVSVDGDLGRIDAAAVKSLTVQSLGALGLTSQVTDGSLVSNLTGNLGKLTVKASIHGASLLSTGSIGTVMINGSFLGGQLSAGADLGAVTVRGDIVGTASAPVIISGFGKAVAPTKGLDVAIRSLKVSGGVDFLRVLAGYDLTLTGLNADASINSIFVGADWRASTVLAGVTTGADGFAGTEDDAKFGPGGGVRDTAEIFSTIARITIKGQAFGSTSNGDSFGIVAEQISAAKVGKATLKLDKGALDTVDAFALGSTGPGATGLASDFFLREVTL